MSSGDRTAREPLLDECPDCGGYVKLVDSANTDASATESFECVDCGATGDVQFFEGPNSPRWYGSVVPA